MFCLYVQEKEPTRHLPCLPLPASHSCRPGGVKNEREDRSAVSVCRFMAVSRGAWQIYQLDDIRGRLIFFVPNIGVGPRNPILINSVMTFQAIPGPLNSICHWTNYTTATSPFHKISNDQKRVLSLYLKHIYIYFK